MRTGTSSGLRQRLVLLIGIALVPAIGLLWWSGLERQRADEREFQTQALNLARLAAQAYQRRIETARQLLIALSHNPEMVGDDAAACDRLVRNLVRDYGALYATIGRADRQGAIECLALDAPRAGLSIADRDYFQKAISSGGFVVGDFMHGKVRRQPTLAFSYPLRAPTGEITRVLFVNIDLIVLSRALEDETRIEGTTISLLDGNGTLIARSAQADKYFGTTASTEQIASMRREGEMVTTFAGPDGVRRVFAIVAIRGDQNRPISFATVGVAESQLAALADSGRRLDLFTVVLLGAGLLAATWIGSEWLVRRPVNKLVAATHALANGQLDARTPPVGGIRELDELNSAFNRMAEKLQQRDVHLREGQRLEAVGQLAGGIAHDFNNLLTVIIGYAHVVAQTVAPQSTTRQQLSELCNAADRAAGLTQQLLAFSRRQVLQPTALQLNEVISDMATLLQRTTGGDISIELALDDRLGATLADRVQIEQVILNLVVNARDAMPRGGTIRLETRNVDVTAAEADGMGLATSALIELSVSDTGIGMDAATRGRVFEPFFTTKGAHGTGLGLATVYGIVKQTGGAIECFSRIGAGTRFRILLPRYDRAAEPATTVDATEPLGGEERVVLVDDDDAVRAVVRTMLVRRGYQVRDTGSAAEALEWFAAGAHADLVLTDLRMPGMNGATLIGELRRRYPALPILVMSGDATAITQAATEHDVPFLQKPVDPKTLARAVRACLHG